MVLALSPHPSRTADLLTEAQLSFQPRVTARDFTDVFGNRWRGSSRPPGAGIWDDVIVEDSGLPDEVAPDAVQHPVEELPGDVLVYLLGSRYCEVDRLGHRLAALRRHAAGLGAGAGDLRLGPRPRPVRLLVRPADQDGLRGFAERTGVCRDFTHLAVTFCRCLNIPARYCTGYLGDIGVPPEPDPMDFSAWFEVYLGGRWYTFDARHNTPRIGRVLMARGRDAVDVALTTSFGGASWSISRW